ncbi:hypothetical protein ACTWQL_02045 [Pseudalkalibacillus sp. R45]
MHSRLATLMVSPVPLIPQDKESFSSVTSPEENAIFILEDSRTLLSNQVAQGGSFQK